MHTRRDLARAAPLPLATLTLLLVTIAAHLTALQAAKITCHGTASRRL